MILMLILLTVCHKFHIFLLEFNRFPELSRPSSPFPGLSSPGKCHNNIPGLSRFSRTRTNPGCRINEMPLTRPQLSSYKRYSAGRDGYQGSKRKVRWVGQPLFLHLARCRVLYENDWGRVRDMPTKCCFLRIETYMLSKTITPEILAMPQSRNCNELLGTFSECLPFFFYRNHNIFHFLKFFLLLHKGVASHSIQPSPSPQVCFQTSQNI